MVPLPSSCCFPRLFRYFSLRPAHFSEPFFLPLSSVIILACPAFVSFAPSENILRPGSRGRFYPSAQPNRPSGTSLSLSHSCSIFGTGRLFQKADPLVQQCLTPGNAIFAGAIYSRLERLVCKSQIASCSFPHALITGSGFERARTLPAREREGKVFRATFLE